MVGMSLLEKSGMILEKGEQMVRRGDCEAKIPKDKNVLTFLAKKVEWQDVKGELVLTSKRLIVVGEKGRIRKQLIPFLDMDLSCVKAVSIIKPLVGKEKLLVSVDVDTPKPEKMEIKVDDPSAWATAIKEQASKQT